MSTTAMVFFLIGATVLWGGLALTLFIENKKEKDNAIN